MNQTLDRLDTLGFSAWRWACVNNSEGSQYLSLSFGLVVDREAEARDTRRLALRLKAAKLRQEATVEDIDFSKRNVQAKVVHGPATHGRDRLAGLMLRK